MHDSNITIEGRPDLPLNGLNS